MAGVLLLIGFLFIRKKRVSAHQKVMWTAFAVSCAFLVCYLVYHYNVGSVKFDKPGWVRTVYLWILGTHTILAAAVPFLAVITLARGQRGRISRHRAIARWTWPIWMYVSITGVVVYLLLYQVRPLL